MPRSFALGEHFESFIDQAVKEGRYNSASEVVRNGLRLLEDQEQEYELNSERIRQMVAEARQTHDYTPAEEVFAELKAKYQAMIADKQ
jgi:antitoxin ParD1/3/4